MPYPKVEINIRKLEYNTRREIEDCARFNVAVMGVNKVFDGMPETAAAVVRGGIEVMAESRIYNLKKYQDLPCLKCLLRSPALSEIEDVVKYADISLNSEIEVIRALSREAVRQGKIHRIMLMIDMGDIREGIWFEDRETIELAVQEMIDLPGVEIYGLGTNFNCYGTVLPTRENGEEFVRLARSLEEKYNIKFKYLSGGNCTSYNLILKNEWPDGLNHLRIGGLNQWGMDIVDLQYLEDYYHSAMDPSLCIGAAYILKAEIIELNRKPTVPRGKLGYDAFMRTKTFEDKGVRKRALLNFGAQDIPCEGVYPVDTRITILGQTSDHTIVDIEDSEQEYRVGDTISFELDYPALLAACNSPGVYKVCVDD